MFQSENVRWAHTVAQYHEQEETLCGDVLLTAAFISYAGSFSKKYRLDLLENLWMPFLRSQKVSDDNCCWTVVTKLLLFRCYKDSIAARLLCIQLVRNRQQSLFHPCIPLLHPSQIPIPMTGGLDPVSMLTDDATIAQWNNEGLPGDKMSTQNATILTNCE